MRIALPHGGKLTITDNVLETMYDSAQMEKKDLEAGGMFIGHHPRDSEDIILDRLTTPQPADHRTRNRFCRNQAAHQLLLNMEWKLSGEKRTYVGEWHTHPEPKPTPSQLDRKSWTKAIRETAFHGPGLVFIIVGTRVVPVWFASKIGKRSLIAEVTLGASHA